MCMDVVIKVVKVITLPSLRSNLSQRHPILLGCLLLLHTSNAGENGGDRNPVSTRDPL
jgi:hypothetical protein